MIDRRAARDAAGAGGPASGGVGAPAPETVAGAPLAAAVADSHVLVVTGAGGVGKTTVAAALGLAAARRGRRTLVLTIDPARRLAQALGVDHLDHTPTHLGLDTPGELWASMLDVRTTFDRLVDRHATSPERAAAIKANRIYRTLTTTLSGTQEYMAMEALHELHEEGRWELLVIDTPPTRNALDFLDAPKRMTSFLEGRLLRMLLRPGLAAGRSYLRVVNLGATAFMRIASRVTGMELLEDLADFFRNFEGMYEGFKQRAEQVLRLLQEPTSRFVVVTSPQPPPLREARFFLDRLTQEGLHCAALVINRIHPTLEGLPEDEELRHRAAHSEDTATAGLLRLLADVRNLAVRERRAVEAALYGLTPPAVAEVPLLDRDVHDLASLTRIATTLAG